MTPSAFLIRDPGWQVQRTVFEVVGVATIGGAIDDVDVGIDGPLAVVQWRDGAWRIRPCSKTVTIDDEPLVDEVVLRHGQLIAMNDLRGWRLRFLIGDRARVLDELRHSESVSDGLTGLLNRRVAYRMLERMTSGVVMLIDIDWLKRINDHFGMLGGDTTIKRTAAILKTRVAWPNIVARYGGEEFVVLMPEATLEAARVLAEDIRIAAEPTFEFEAESLTATLSIGLALHTGDGTPALRTADEALADAKRQGRNRVVG